MTEVDVLIAGAGPIGLTAAIELRRRGVRVRIVDPLLEPPQYAKAVGIQPRTLEVFESMGVVGQVLDAGLEMRGQLVYVNGSQVSRVDLSTPPDVPYRFHLLPQYATERILRARLTDLGTEVDRGTAVSAFDQDADGVTVTLTGPDGDTTIRAGYLLGADGAHSVVRKGLGLSFEGAAFTEQYMLGDVVADWSMPQGYAIRSMHQTADGTTDDQLVCIPLPGRGRYRMSMLVPDELAVAPTTGGDGVAHGFEGTRAPELSHIQAVVDRLARNMDASALETLGPDDPLRFEVRGVTLSAIDSFAAGGGFAGDGYMLVSDQTFHRIFPNRSTGAPDHILIKIAPDADPGVVLAALQAQFDGTGLRVRSFADAALEDQDYQTTERPTGLIFGFGVVIGVLVGIVIVYQILSTDVADHLAEYATFKAMGYGQSMFLGIVLEQAVILGILGFVPGIAVSWLLYEMLGAMTGLPVELTFATTAAVFVGTIIACLVSGAIATRRLAAADPADLF